MEKSSGGAADCHYDCGSCVVRISDFPQTPKSFGELIHELLHATFYVLTYSGVDYIPGGSNEAYTYLHEWLIRNALTTDGYEEI